MLTLAQGDPALSAHENMEKVNLQALMVREVKQDENREDNGFCIYAVTDAFQMNFQ